MLGRDATWSAKLTDYERALGGHEGPFRWLLALDDWHPNYHGAWVLARVVWMRPWRGRPAHFRLLVSGADDSMMARDNLTQSEAIALLKLLPPLIDRRTLSALGLGPY